MPLLLALVLASDSCCGRHDVADFSGVDRRRHAGDVDGSNARGILQSRALTAVTAGAS
jgi:hypothetical protein